MKCSKCGADLYEGIKKCPYCKTFTQDFAEDGKFKDFDFKYTISPTEQLKVISSAAKASTGSEKKTSRKKSASLLPFKIKRIEKPQQTQKNEEVTEPLNSAEKANSMAKSASRSAAEFVPEGLARYTIRGGNNEEIHPVNNIKPQISSDSISEYTRVKNNNNNNKERAKRVVRKRHRKSFNIKIDKRMVLAFAASAVAVLAVVLGVTAIINAASKNDEVASSYTYIKDNAMYVVYKGKPSKISEQVVCDSYLRYAEENTAAPSAEKAAKDSGLVKESKDGKRTYFFDNFDPETESGTLKLVKSGKAKKVVEISPAAHNSLVMSNDGKAILYLATADKNGDMGVLYYWNEKLEEPLKIATDIDHGTFGFAGNDEWVMFIQNLNRIEMQGDLYVKNLKNQDDEKLKIDTSVCKIYGANPGKAAYIYGKDYDKNDKTFDIYAINETGRTIRLGERTKRDPLMQKTKNSLFVYGATEDNTSNLYEVDIKSGKKEKIASGIGSILMLSKNEKTVIYDKVYKGSLADYYAYTKGKQPQMIAHNVVVDYNAVAGKPQMAVDENVTKILYISEFESFKGGGTLNLTTYKNGKIISEEQIAEDVYAVYRGADGRFIVAKDYSTSRKIFDIYLLKGTEIKLLKEEISPEMFEVSALGDNIFCVTGFGVEGKYGNLEKVNLKGEFETVANQVFDFDLTAQEDILIYSNLNTEDGKFDLGLRMSGKRKILEIDSAVDEIIGY